MKRNQLVVALLPLMPLAMVATPHESLARNTLQDLRTRPAIGTTTPAPSTRPAAASRALGPRANRAKRLRSAGIGLTITGLTIFAAGWASGWSSNWGLIIGGLIVGSSIGGATTVMGTTLWIVGGVRYSIALAEEQWRAKRKSWIRAGLAVTGSGGAVALAGSVLLMAYFLDPKVHDPVAGVGGILLGVGAAVALLAGIPMWATAHCAHGEEGVAEHGLPWAAARLPTSLSLDPHHEQRLAWVLSTAAARPIMITGGFSFGCSSSQIRIVA